MSRSTLALLTVALFLSSVFPGFAHARWFQRNVHQTRTIAEIPNTTGVVYVLLVDGEEVTTTTITASETSYVTVPVYANSTAPVNATSVPTSVLSGSSVIIVTSAPSVTPPPYTFNYTSTPAPTNLTTFPPLPYSSSSSAPYPYSNSSTISLPTAPTSPTGCSVEPTTVEVTVIERETAATITLLENPITVTVTEYAETTTVFVIPLNTTR